MREKWKVEEFDEGRKVKKRKRERRIEGKERDFLKRKYREMSKKKRKEENMEISSKARKVSNQFERKKRVVFCPDSRATRQSCGSL